MATAYQNPHLRSQVQELIITMRKAMSQQRQLEETCKQVKIDVEYQWSTNQLTERFLPKDTAC